MECPATQSHPVSVNRLLKFPEHADEQFISSTCILCHELLGHQYRTIATPFDNSEDTATSGMIHPKFAHGPDQSNPLPLVHGPELHNHNNISHYSVTPNYPSDPFHYHELAAGQQFPKELSRLSLHNDETKFSMSKRSHFMELVKNVRDISRDLTPGVPFRPLPSMNLRDNRFIMTRRNPACQREVRNIRDTSRGFTPGVPFQPLQSLSHFSHDSYLELLEPQHSYGQKLQVFHQINERSRDAPALSQVCLPLPSLPHATVLGIVYKDVEFWDAPTSQCQEMGHHYTTDQPDQDCMYQCAPETPYDPSTHLVSEWHTNSINPVPVPPTSSVHSEVVNGQMGSFDRPANYRSNLHASGNRTSAMDLLRKALTVEGTQDKIGDRRKSKLKEFYTRFARLFVPPTCLRREIEFRNHRTGSLNNPLRSYSFNSTPAKCKPHPDEARTRYSIMVETTIIPPVANPPSESQFSKNGRVAYSPGWLDKRVEGYPLSATGNCFRVPFRNHDPDLLV